MNQAAPAESNSWEVCTSASVVVPRYFLAQLTNSVGRLEAHQTLVMIPTSATPCEPAFSCQYADPQVDLARAEASGSRSGLSLL